MRAEDDDAGGGEFVGARLDAGLRAARFASPPSADEFAAAVEPRNAPAVFRGVVKDWTASSRWDPRRGGLDYLRVLVPFSKFMNSCKSYLRCPNASSDSPKAQEILKEPASSEEGCSSSLESCDQVYLAQVSILNTENKERCSLEVLKEDIQEPTFLRGKPFSSINIWMNRAHLRSSTHYDPHHNLLCVVAGCKKVIASFS